jgi:hypothetical protein
VSGYARLEREAGRPKPITDHRDAWERLTPLLGVDGTARQRVEAFCESNGSASRR